MKKQEEVGLSMLSLAYMVYASLVTVCDLSLGFIYFSQIMSASSSNEGSIKLEWETAELMSFNKNHLVMCTDDSIFYNVFVLLAPFDFSLFSLPELI